MANADTERRQYKRYALTTRWSVFHLPSGRTFPCRCIDISASGARFWAPVSMPIRQGHEVTLMPTENLTHELSGYLGDNEIDASVVWVNREPILTDGHIQFASRMHGGQ